MRIEICHLTSIHPRYDVRIFEKECKTLANFYKVTLVVADGGGNEETDGIQIIDVGKKTANRVLRILITPWRIYRYARKLKNCEYFHFHDPELLIVGLLLRRIHKKKVIYDSHEDVPQDILLKNWIPRAIRKPVAGIYSALEKYVTRQFSAIVCATPHIKSRFLKFNNYSYDIKNYPILDWQGQREEVILDEIEYDLCYVGLISENRGIFELIEVLNLMNVSIVLAGPFESEHLRSRLIALENWPRVKYLGILNRSNVQKLLSKSLIGIVVLERTPTFLNSLPIKLFEYMAAAMPVISSNFPDWEEIIEKSNCGICIEPKNVEMLCEAIKKLMDNPKLAISMGKNGLNAIRTKYSWASESEELVGIYKKIR